ncbi:uncharacterized protein LOC116022837 [Ipomoea triloba]|uniref:uncharacterized protein LOC116022837 n=1 Tax=Ipomoea triloba TaxID=35885 RepID=UPI00125E8A21|nr:uncharacterized protein LOC116022837 [Ipomoea triloba]
MSEFGRSNRRGRFELLSDFWIALQLSAYKSCPLCESTSDHSFLDCPVAVSRQIPLCEYLLQVLCQWHHPACHLMLLFLPKSFINKESRNKKNWYALYLKIWRT